MMRSAISAVLRVAQATEVKARYIGSELKRTLPRPQSITTVVAIRTCPTRIKLHSSAWLILRPFFLSAWYRLKKWIASSAAIPRQIVKAHTISRDSGNSKAANTAAHASKGNRFGIMAINPIWSDLYAMVIMTRMIIAAAARLRAKGSANGAAKSAVVAQKGC